MIARLQQLLVAVSVAALAVVFALVVLQVVLRYGVGITPYFTTEIARFALVWSVLAGAAASVDSDRHIRVGFVSELLSRRANAVLDRAFDAIAALLFGVLTWAGSATVDAARGQTSEGLQIPLVWPYAILPAAFGAALVFALRRALRARGAN